MMKLLYSDYTVEQLREEVGKLKEQLIKAEQLGEVNKAEVYERKLQIASSYLLNPEDFKPNDVHRLNGDPGFTFKINYIDGVMAWGHRINLLGEMKEKEEAIPIAMLGEKVVQE